MAAQDTDLDCGKWLAEDIADGLIAETDLTASGRRKLWAWRAANRTGPEDLTQDWQGESYSEFEKRMQENLKFLDL